ncbi:MAG: hypothetical protein H6820_15305 [Phycisphaerales bacterium]|nr:hypothetical protein [Phycisphaerales bacterium]
MRLRVQELTLLRRMLQRFDSGDVIVADRAIKAMQTWRNGDVTASTCCCG